MKKDINHSSIIIMLLAVSIVVMSVGFANFTESLTIGGTTQVKGATWNVGFVTDSYTESTSSVTVSDGNRTIGTTSMTYDVTLNKPGEFYEFTIDVKNSGTFNANLTGITLTALSEAQSKYLTYTLTYNGIEYSTSASNLSIALNSSATATVKVRVEYVQPESPDDLPDTAQKITLDAALSYVQAA